MKFREISHIFLIAIGLLGANAAFGQKIAKIEPDPAVTMGVVPNGLTWYVAANPSLKGVADFALVQLRGAGEEMTERELSPFVQEYFARLGVVPDEGGFIKEDDHAVVYRFNNVNLLQSPSVMDSTLFVMMGIVDMAQQSEDSTLKSGCPASSQAVIVSGDVDPKQVSEKLKMLSYMVQRGEAVRREEYVWKECDTTTVSLEPSSRTSLAEISVSWRLQTTPKEYRNTVQPIVFEQYMTQLGMVAEDRIEESFRKSGVPVADVSCAYHDGVGTLGDADFSIAVSVRPDDLSKAVTTVSQVMASLNADGASVKEVRNATKRYFNLLAARDLRTENRNSDYVDRCVSSFIYDAPLTTVKDILAFLQSKSLPDSTIVKIFRSIASAATDPGCNLVLSARTDDGKMTADSLKMLFESAWVGARTASCRDSIPVIPHLESASGKVKVKSQRKEYLSGGTLWTLGNGMRVIVKQLPTEGVVYYSLALNGGYGNIPDLCAGEGACVSDYMRYCTVGGVDSRTFLDMAMQRGILMDLDIDVSKTVISGKVFDDRLDYMFRMLLTMLNGSHVNEEKLAYYLACGPLRSEYRKNTLMDRVRVVDSLMCPGNRYTAYPEYGHVSGDLGRKVEEFFRHQSQKVNDGVLILVGDVDEKLLKEAIQKYAGGFGTAEKAFSRPVINCQPLAGGISYKSEGEKNIVDVAMSAPLALTADNYYVSTLASMVLRRYLAQTVTGNGMTLRLKHRFEKYPQERLGFLISLSETSSEPGEACEDPAESLAQVRQILSELQSLEISDAELSSYKTRLKKGLVLKKSDPEYWTRILTFRYLDGKDLMTGAEAKIDAVTKDDIRKVLALLGDGSRVEYIITR